jgi:spore germination protein KC
VFCLLLVGCWDKNELNDILIVTGIAVDKGEEKRYLLTVEAVNATQLSKQGGEGNTPSISFSLEGNSISELSNKMNVGMARKLIYSHTRILVISEQVAREGITGFLDFLERSGDFRNDFNILISRKYKASDYISTVAPVQKVSSIKINKQIEAFLEEWGGDPNIRLTDLLSSITSNGRTPVLAAVTIKGDPAKGKSVENIQRVDLDALVELDGLAVFDNKKVVGFLTLEDARNYLWTQDLNRTSISVPCGEEDEQENEKFIDVRIVTSASSINASYKGNEPKLKVKINGEAHIDGTQCSKDLTKVETFQEYEKRVNDFILTDVEGTIQKVQDEYGVDIFGFGDALYRQHYDKFKQVEDQWNEEFTRGEIEVEVYMHLRRSGIRNKSFISNVDEKP